MSSLSYLSVAEHALFQSTNGYANEIANLIFQPDDYIEESRPFSALNLKVWGDENFSRKGKFTFRGFKQSVKVCKQRLEIYGHSLKSANEDFKQAKKSCKKDYFYSFPLNNITFKKFLDEVKYILNNTIEPPENYHTNFRDSLIEDDLYFYGQSISSNLYSIFSLLKETDIVEYDLTEIIQGGWISKDLPQKQIFFQKIIILTEGKTDVEFISSSLKLLYPHLFPYYHFINFDEYKVESNASALVKLVVSFAAANIKHPIIVLFDNDTTGIMEMKALLSKKIPQNFKILKLPDLKFAKRYPTFGPTGIKKMNVNGLACGIEMYLGEDVLKRDNKFVPVQWKGFNDKEKKYQGELSDKATIQNNFREKLKSKTQTNYAEMDILLTEIFNAFRIK